MVKTRAHIACMYGPLISSLLVACGQIRQKASAQWLFTITFSIVLTYYIYYFKKNTIKKVPIT